jgi:hypothetical protein
MKKTILRLIIRYLNWSRPDCDNCANDQLPECNCVWVMFCGNHWNSDTPIPSDNFKPKEGGE